MNIKTYKAIIAMFSGVVLLSCTEDIAKELFSQRTPIAISASVTSQEQVLTRAAEGLNTDAGFTLSSTAAYNKVCVNIDGDEYIYSITGEEGASTGTTLDIDETQPYFPLGETSVSVSARYPDYADDITKSEGTTYFTIQEDQTTQDAYLRSDLMTATATATRTQKADGKWNVTEASLVFQHQMAKLIINAGSEDEDHLKVKKIVINDVNPRVPMTGNNFIVGNAITTSSGEKYDVVAIDEESGVVGVCESAVIIPAQSFAPELGETQRAFATLTVGYNDPNTVANDWEDITIIYYLTGEGKTFAANKVYTMNIQVGIDNIKLYDTEENINKVDISAWNPADATTINIFPTVVHTLLNQFGVIQNIPDQTYIGAPIRLSSTDLVVKANNSGAETTLRLNQDYTVTYANNIEAGTATVTAVGIGLYSGMTSKTFQIVPRNINDENVVIADFPTTTYNGEEKELAVILQDNAINKHLYLDTDYTLEYPEDIINAGTKTVTITGTNNYTGTRTTSYTISKAEGDYEFADAMVRSYVPTGKTVSYTNALTIKRGQGSITSATSSNSSVASVASNGTVTLKSAGNTTITLHIEGSNYSFEDYTYTISLKSGPILPIMYVGPYNMGTYNSMATDNSSLSTCYFPWNRDNMETYYDMQALKLNGLTKDGIHYHLPSQQEWSSIVPTTRRIYLDEEKTETGVTENVAFGVTIKATKSAVDPSDYTYAVTNTTWTSDFYSNGDGTTYALRFKGSTYCCAYRYDYLWNTPENLSLTGNRTGPSLVVRVIYKGSSFTYGGGKDVTSLVDEDWDHPEFKVVLPCSGYQLQGEPAGVAYRESMAQGYGYYYSATPANDAKTSYYRLVISTSGAHCSGTHYDQANSVRLFRDAY